MSTTSTVRVLALAVALFTPAAFAAEKADAVNGKTIFEQLCGICHAVASDGSGPTMGPNLFGLIGRKAASEPNFAMYTPALKALGFAWDARLLDEFLNNPATRVPGTTMPVTLPASNDRADVIAYLASLE